MSYMYSSLGIMQPNTVEKLSVGQRLGLDLADWGISKVSLFAGWSKITLLITGGVKKMTVTYKQSQQSILM